jgi:P27 family predicted phage terminase small subunit
MASPKPKPTHLKLLTGNPGKRKLNKNEPCAASSLPHPPSWLTARAKAIFRLLVKRIDGMGYASSSHTESLGLCAWRLDQVEQCEAVIRTEGMTYGTETMGGSTMWRSRPEVALQSEAARHAQSLLCEFGLTPSSASKVSVPGKPKSNAFNTL